MSMYKEMVKAHPSLERGLVWCRTCRREVSVRSENCLQRGWPKCCGHTMTIDHPDTWAVPCLNTETEK
jgi:Zn finger protein HypA/HybF involved in hydrogenase expression